MLAGCASSDLFGNDKCQGLLVLLCSHAITEDAFFTTWTSDSKLNEASWKRLQLADPQLFNVNDDMDSSRDLSTTAAQRELQSKLEAKFPDPSPFELV